MGGVRFVMQFKSFTGVTIIVLIGVSAVVAITATNESNTVLLLIWYILFY